MRVACLFVPLFPLAARLRSEPELKDEAVASVEGNGNAARVVAATRPARRAGMDAGHDAAPGAGALPKLTARARDRESERAAQEALLEVADAFSPRVEDGGEGVVYLDLEGIPALSGDHKHEGRPDGESAGDPGAERALGRDLIAAVEKAGLPARVGIASSKLAARVAAGLPDSPTVVPPR